MKKEKQCPKCQSLRIGWIQEQPDKQEIGYRPRAAGLVLNTGFFQDPVGPRGVLEAVVCTDCGYYETYVTAPETVEWEKLIGFQWLNEKAPDGAGPYR